MVYPTWYGHFGEVAEEVARMGLKVWGVHADKTLASGFAETGTGDWDEAISRFTECADLAGGLGASKVVVHLWGNPRSDECLERNVVSYDALKSIAGERGLELCVETIPCKVGTPMDALKRIARDREGLLATLDLRHLALHNQVYSAVEDAAYDGLWASGAVRQIHFNDVRAMGGYEGWRDMRPLGKGSIDFGRLMDGLRKRRFAGEMTMESYFLDGEGAFLAEGFGECVDWLERFHDGVLGGAWVAD